MIRSVRLLATWVCRNESPLEKGDIIYLEPKHKRATPPHFEHRIQVGESIHRIAQTYGIQLKSLYQLNNLTPEYLPMEGDILRLR